MTTPLILFLFMLPVIFALNDYAPYFVFVYVLYRWRFVVHGRIDGFSRFIVYLSCNTNNRSSTVFKLFHIAVQDYGIPDRLQSDKRGGNVKVCCVYMYEAQTHYSML